MSAPPPCRACACVEQRADRQRAWADAEHQPTEWPIRKLFVRIVKEKQSAPGHLALHC
jgi:hypothetical protein